MIEFRNVSFSFGKKTVLDNISFAAENGKLTAVLGMNGQGKSTVLKLADGILKPKTGEVLIDGESVKRLSAKEIARRISVVQQQPVFGSGTVFGAVLSGRTPFMSLSPSEKDVEIAAETVEKLGIAGISFSDTDKISGGERQLTAIARALAGKNGNLLLDEPTNNLDIKNQIEIMNILRRCAREDGTAVLVTMHDVELALRMADSIMLIRDGNVIFSGKAEDVTEEKLFEAYGIRTRITMNEGIRSLSIIINNDGEEYDEKND